MSAYDPKRTLPISCPHPFQSTTAGCYGAVLNLGEAMSQRDKAGGKVVKTQRRTALKRNTPKVGRTLPSADANRKIELLERRLKEALEQQTATSEVLQVISSSAGELQPVFQAMLEKAVRICDANFGNLYLREGDAFRIGATYGASPAYVEFLRTEQLFHLNPKVGLGRLVRTKELYHVADISAVPTHGDKLREATIKLAGARTLIALPMLKDNEVIGAIVIYRQVVRPFTDKQIELVKNFAAQAVIAIENTRLLNELRQRTDDLSEALEQQTATSEVLKVISSSPGELEAVFQILLENATRICEAAFGSMLHLEGDVFRRVALHNAPPAFAKFHKQAPTVQWREVSDLKRVVETKQVIHIADTAAEHPDAPIARYAGGRTLLLVPMLKDEDLVGVIGIYRQEVRPFTDKQIDLVKNFAAQAVIAIENTRLLSELRESLEQQTATSEVLKVISSSPGELEPVFNAMLENAVRICEAKFGILFLSEGEAFRTVALHGAPPAYAEARRREPVFRPNPGMASGRVARTKQPVQIADIRAEPAYTGDPQRFAILELAGARTMLNVPMLKEDELVGQIAIYRQEVRPFTDKQIELLTNFAAQAVIAIENARLLQEQRESLERQTATAEVLRIISSSPGELQPVFDAMLQNATRICEATLGGLFLYKGDAFRAVAVHGDSYYADWSRREPDLNMHTDLHKGTPLERLTHSKKFLHIHDLRADESYLSGNPRIKALAESAGARTHLVVPMLKDDELVGAIVIYRQDVRPFGDKQIELVQNFAAQAVIAIENTRLLSELRESLQQQAATADVLKAISRSTFDLQAVLETLTESAARLCDSDMAAITRQKGTAYYYATTYGYPSELDDYLMSVRHEPGRGSVIGRTIVEGKTTHVPDVLADAEYTQVEVQKKANYRTVLGVPLLREGNPIGVIVLLRHKIQPFTDKQIELVEIFADQAVIAIENVRLFDDVQKRTRELAKSLKDLRTAQDRLVQTEKLASLGQLTAGIAHEIKNPLNFVNNFSGLSAELIDELQDSLADVSFNEKRRSEITELMDTLRGNLVKVVQHGKRADEIVKNMLLHSRQGSGDHRPVDINALVEESLNLAYHGARAEKQGFNITLERSLDPAAGEADLSPQEITRALLNLISNGFYAASKRKADTNGNDYEPTLGATTRSLGDSVEIRIRDNGTGIPSEVKEMIFNPFFTTKPAGEGTGLGLSISHDIIVKQHGGSIEVDTQPGAFTEFRIVLPRIAATIAKSGDRP